MVAVDYRRPDLRELMSREGKINARAFGRLLTRHLDRVRGGWCVAFARTDHKVSVYRLLGPKDAKQGEFRAVRGVHARFRGFSGFPTA